MNYIKRLEKENKDKELEIRAYSNTIEELTSYLFSQKFEVDPTVQARDVLHRLEQGLHFHRQEYGI